MSDKHAQFKEALDNNHQWPCPYIYKFIVPSENIAQLVALFPEENIETKIQNRQIHQRDHDLHHVFG